MIYIEREWDICRERDEKERESQKKKIETDRQIDRQTDRRR